MSRLMDQARAQQVFEAQRRRTALGDSVRRQAPPPHRMPGAIAAPSVRLTGQPCPALATRDRSGCRGGGGG